MTPHPPPPPPPSLPPITRPSGRIYRPRRLRVVGWDVLDRQPESWQLAVLGTHDVAVARDAAPRGFHCAFLVNPTRSWVRLGLVRGEPTWLYDDARGAACVVFDERDDPDDDPTDDLADPPEEAP